MTFADIWSKKPSEIPHVGMIRMVISRSRPGSIGETLAKLMSPLIEKDMSLSEFLQVTDPSSLDGLMKIIDHPITDDGSMPASATPMLTCPYCHEAFVLRN